MTSTVRGFTADTLAQVVAGLEREVRAERLRALHDLLRDQAFRLATDDGGLDALIARAQAPKRLRLTLAPGSDADLGALAWPGCAWSRPGPVELTALLAPGCDVPALLQKALAACTVVDVRLEEPSIESVIAAMYSRPGAAETR